MPAFSFSTWSDVGPTITACGSFGLAAFYYGFRYQKTWLRLVGYILYALALLLLLAFWGFPLTQSYIPFVGMLLMMSFGAWEVIRLLHTHVSQVNFRELHLAGVAKTIIGLLPIYGLTIAPWRPLIALPGIALCALGWLFYGIMQKDHIFRLIAYALFGAQTLLVILNLPLMACMASWQWYFLSVPIISCLAVIVATVLVYLYRDQFEQQEQRYAFGYCFFLSLVNLYSWFSLIAVRCFGKEKYTGPSFLRPFFDRSAPSWSTRTITVQTLLAGGAALAAFPALLLARLDRSRILSVTGHMFGMLCGWRCYNLMKNGATKTAFAILAVSFGLFLAAEGINYYWGRK